MPSQAVRELLDFDVDRYLNPFIPHNRLYILPQPVSRFLGYRKEAAKEPYVVLQWLVTILATVGGLCLAGGIGNYAPGIVDYHPPVMIASLGASAILDFNTIKSPLAQPRNSILGNTLAAICGVAIAKLFQLNSNFDNIQWLSGAVGCALASWVMSVTNTVHPPGGATAVLASTQGQVIAMGWKYIPIVMLDSTLLVCVALLFNNVFRQYPVFWWTPQKVGRQLRQEKKNAKLEEEGNAKPKSEEPPPQHLEDKSAESDASSDRTLQREPSNSIEYLDDLAHVSVKLHSIQIPRHVELSKEEIEMLENVQQRLRAHAGRW